MSLMEVDPFHFNIGMFLLDSDGPVFEVLERIGLQTHGPKFNFLLLRFARHDLVRVAIDERICI